MDYIFLIGIVLDTTSDFCADGLEYKIKGFCLFDYHKQACKFVSIKGYKDWVDYFTCNILNVNAYKDLKHQLMFLCSPDVSVVHRQTGEWVGISSNSIYSNLSVLNTLILYDSNLKVISLGYRHKCLGRIVVRYGIFILLMLDVDTMKTFEVLYYHGAPYYTVDDLYDRYRRFVIPYIYFDCTELTDIKYCSIGSNHNYYCVGEKVFAFLTDIDTYSAGEAVRELHIVLNVTKYIRSFNLIISDKLKDFSFDFEGRGFVEDLNIYIPKGFYSDWLVQYVYSEVLDIANYLGYMRNEYRKYASKLMKLYNTKNFGGLIDLRVDNNYIHQEVYLLKSGMSKVKYNFFYY